MIRFRARRWAQETLANRLCQLIYGQLRVWQEAGGRWHIGTANDWWLYPQGDETYLLHYRYADPDRMRHLAEVMAFLLDIEILEVS